ncbi:metal-sulfur cluster assembly factor [Frankia sp. Cr1]|uniref:metal-sulfur cluster assembly factor n=1 Tax=Frankia sp. Cr1 TaxID=3073931 RepID=UPI002AD22DC5|nr:iron-sulfur cluster assembly protein [Frankia sp. Cr1]
MTVTEARVREVLNTILDPCSVTAGVPAGLDDMGLVHDVRVMDDGAGGQQVSVAVGVTEPTCLLLGSFAAEAKRQLRGLPGVSAVDVRLKTDLDWSEQDLAPDYRRKLKEHRQILRSTIRLPIVPLDACRRVGPAGQPVPGLGR